MSSQYRDNTLQKRTRWRSQSPSRQLGLDPESPNQKFKQQPIHRWMTLVKGMINRWRASQGLSTPLWEPTQKLSASQTQLTRLDLLCNPIIRTRWLISSLLNSSLLLLHSFIPRGNRILEGNKIPSFQMAVLVEQEWVQQVEDNSLLMDARVALALVGQVEGHVVVVAYLHKDLSFTQLVLSWRKTMILLSVQTSSQEQEKFLSNSKWKEWPKMQQGLKKLKGKWNSELKQRGWSNKRSFLKDSRVRRLIEEIRINNQFISKSSVIAEQMILETMMISTMWMSNQLEVTAIKTKLWPQRLDTEFKSRTAMERVIMDRTTILRVNKAEAEFNKTKKDLMPSNKASITLLP